MLGLLTRFVEFFVRLVHQSTFVEVLDTIGSAGGPEIVGYHQDGFVERSL